MGRQRWWAPGLAAVAVFTVAGCATLGDGVSSEAPGGDPSASRGAGGHADDGMLPGMPTVAQARKELAGLRVAPHASMSGYSRAKFPHWAEQGDSCDTREVVLERDGTGVKRDSACRAVSGRWVSVYDGVAITAASELDIDHMVPLANAWRSGAHAWTQDKRKAFANDLTHPQLLAASASSNRSKGDQGPDEWQPPARAYWCTYGRAWTSVKSTYQLSVTAAEKSMLTTMLDTCK